MCNTYIIHFILAVSLQYHCHQVLDARPKGRFDGTVPEANPSWYSGHILGSINIPFTSMLDPTTKLFKTKDAIQQSTFVEGCSIISCFTLQIKFIIVNISHFE